MEAKQQKDSGDTWRVESLRLTAFASEGVGIATDANKWWEAVVGEPPESRTEKVREAVCTIEGHLIGAKIVLNVALNRVDWILAVDIDLQKDITEFPSIGPYGEVEEVFNAKVGKWLAICPPVTRLAWGASLVYPVKDRENGYQALQKYLHSVKLDPKNSSDLLYQINRARNSTVIPKLKINRLQKWSVIAFHKVQMLMMVGGGAAGSKSPALNGCRVELDINTEAERKDPLPKDKVESVFNELVSLGDEIAREGEIP